MHDIEDHTETIRGLIPQLAPLEELYAGPHKTCAKIRNDAAWNDLDIKVFHVPIAEVVEKVAGPIHRNWDVDWKMEVVGEDHIKLRTDIPAITRKYGTIAVNIHVFSGFPTCNVVKVEEVPLVINKTSYKVVCS